MDPRLELSVEEMVKPFSLTKLPFMENPLMFTESFAKNWIWFSVEVPDPVCVTYSLYVPLKTFTLSPEAAVLAAFCMVFQGEFWVPAFVSTPEGETKYSAARTEEGSRNREKNPAIAKVMADR